MIKVKNLNLKFTKEYYALYNLSFKIADGEKVAFYGKSASGKTSMMRILCRLEAFDSGEVYIKNIPLKKLDFKIDISMGYQPEKPVFMENKTVYKNLEYVLKDSAHSKYEIDQIIMEGLLKYNLQDKRDVKIKKLTLFEKYVVSLLRLSFKKRDLVLIDNIFKNLSNSQITVVNRLIRKLITKDNTVIIATDDEKIAKKYATRIINFELGSIKENK